MNDRAINAFALPGGHVYINRGVIEAADNEAQLAGVMAHETSHAALRHGTNQASKASAAQVPLEILGGLLGSNSNFTELNLAPGRNGLSLSSLMGIRPPSKCFCARTRSFWRMRAFSQLSCGREAPLAGKNSAKGPVEG